MSSCPQFSPDSPEMSSSNSNSHQSVQETPSSLLLTSSWRSVSERRWATQWEPMALKGKGVSFTMEMKTPWRSPEARRISPPSTSVISVPRLSPSRKSEAELWTHSPTVGPWDWGRNTTSGLGRAYNPRRIRKRETRARSILLIAFSSHQAVKGATARLPSLR